MHFTYKKLFLAIIFFVFISFWKISVPSKVWALCRTDTCACGCNNNTCNSNCSGTGGAGGCSRLNSCSSGYTCCAGDCVKGGSGCPGDTISCAPGTHDNGRCSGGVLNPPCCSADTPPVTQPPSTRPPLTAPPATAPPAGGGGSCVWDWIDSCSVSCGSGIRHRQNSCTGTIQGVTCNTQACPPGATPTPTPAPTPAPATKWWQVKDGDISSSGNIISSVPSAKYLNTDGLGGFPGVPVYGGSLTTGSGTTSTKLWGANTANSLTRIFNYSYFKNLIPANTTLNDVSLLTSGGVTTDGYEWFKTIGDYTINSDINFGSRKVILFVEEGNLNINAKINLTDNSGFFGAFVNGNINVASTVTGSPALEGMYVADNTFTTGAGSTQLYIRGSVASYGGLTLQRDLVDNSIPAELFEFAPDQIMLFPEKLKFARTKWLEVAP